MDTFLKFLEGHCYGDDAHDGYGDPRPLLERCGMCASLYEAHRKEMDLQKYKAAIEYLRAEAKKIPLGEGNVEKGFSSIYNALTFSANILEDACAGKKECQCAQASCPKCGPSGDDEGRIISGKWPV